MRGAQDFGVSGREKATREVCAGDHERGNDTGESEHSKSKRRSERLRKGGRNMHVTCEIGEIETCVLGLQLIAG